MNAKLIRIILFLGIFSLIFPASSAFAASTTAIITISAVNSVTSSTATLNGNITSIGKSQPTVILYWGTKDGKKKSGDWESNFIVGSQGVAAFAKSIAGLNPGTKYYFTASATNSSGTSWPVSSLNFTTFSNISSVTVSPSSNITSSVAVLNGNITSTGGENPTVTVYWGTTDGGQTPANWANNSKFSKAQGVSSFNKKITGLNPKTKYYFTASATNSAGISWPTASLDFITLANLPAISLDSATNIIATGSTISGNVASTGGENPIVTLYWGTTDGKKDSAKWQQNSTPSTPMQPQSLGAFVKDITGLSVGKKYYFTASATNSAGTVWAKSSLNFSTFSIPTVTISKATSLTTTTATLNGNITATGGENSDIIMYWGTTDGGTNPDNWANNSIPTNPSQAQGKGAFYKNITGLNPSTKYYFTAKAKNTAGASWPKSSLSFTTQALTSSTITISAATNVVSATATLNGNITAIGKAKPTVTFYWGTTDGGQTATSWEHNLALASPNLAQGVGAFVKNITGLNPGTKYYFSALAHNSYGDNWPVSSLNFTTLAVSTITLSSATNISLSGATLNGNITSTGGENPTVTIYWGTTDGGQTPANWANSSAPTSPSQPQVIGAFYKDIADLNPGTKYYFTTIAHNSVGNSWPVASSSFTTPALNAPEITLSAATNLTTSSVTLNGDVINIGSNNPTVTIYWGTTDGGQTPANWANSSAPTSPSQPQVIGAFYKDITDLNPGTKYYFTAKATNNAGDSWPSSSLSFTLNSTSYTIIGPDNGTTAYTLTITPNNGSASGSSFSSSYSSGSVVTFTAVPTDGYAFDHWSGDMTGDVNPLTITMDSDKNITANFVPAPEAKLNSDNATASLLSKVLNFFVKTFTINF